MQGAVALALGVGPALGSSGGASSSSAQLPLRGLLADYFLTNTLSAQKLHTLASSSAASGAQGLEDLVAAGAHGTAPQNLAGDFAAHLHSTLTLANPLLRRHPCQGQGHQAGNHGQHSLLVAP